MQESELIACIANVIGSRELASATFDALVALLLEELCLSGSVQIPDLGTFRIVAGHTDQPSGPGETKGYPAAKMIAFTPVSDLKQEMQDYTL